MNYTVYIIKSEKTNRRYIGYTGNISKRLKEHNEGINQSTRNKEHWILIYTEKGFKSREKALKREKELKKMKGGIKLKALLKHAGIV